MKLQLSMAQQRERLCGWARDYSHDHFGQREEKLMQQVLLKAV